MQAIRGAIALEKPTEELLRRTYETLQELHGRAYGWEPPSLNWRLGASSRRMRAYVREWITEWDLRRLYPDETPEIGTSDVKFSYGEDIDVETEPDDQGSAASDGDAGASD
jgi:hypothetical protein